MAKITATVLQPFSYKGKQYQVDDEITIDAGHAANYEKLDYIKVTREAEKKIEAAQEKNSKAGPNAPKFKN